MYVDTQVALKAILGAENVVLYGASSSGLRVLANLRFIFGPHEKNTYFFDGNQFFLLLN